MLKCDKDDLRIKVNKVVECYNSAYHSAIKQTPKEAVINSDNADLILQNSGVGTYGKMFKKTKKETFDKGQKVLISQTEIIKGVRKLSSGRFMDDGVILEKFADGSYLVRKNDGRLVKKRNYDLKGVV